MAENRLRMSSKGVWIPPKATQPSPESWFAEVALLIEQARERAYQAVNTELIDLYWRVGEYLSRKIESAEWGVGIVDRLARYLARTQPDLRGFSRQNLFRMRQFFEAYRADQKVSPLVRQLPWTHHLIILGQSKRAEEREFYVRMAIRERWGKRELEREFRSGLFERVVLSPPKVSPAVTQLHPDASQVFKDAYVLEFLDLPDTHSERDLHKGLLGNLRQFLIEMGRDFCFIGSETPVQVGGRDFALDLLFFHRGLNCLVAIELKTGRFEPEHLGKLEFYLEALDRNIKKPRAPVDRRAVVRHQGHRGRRVRAQPLGVAGTDRRVSAHPSRQGRASCEAARVLPAPGGAEAHTLGEGRDGLEEAPPLNHEQ